MSISVNMSVSLSVYMFVYSSICVSFTYSCNYFDSSVKDSMFVVLIYTLYVTHTITCTRMYGVCWERQTVNVTGHSVSTGYPVSWLLTLLMPVCLLVVSVSGSSYHCVRKFVHIA